MFGGKTPPSLTITTGAAIGANYVGTPHMGGSVSPSSSTSSSSSPCPSTPSSSSTHTFSMQHNHFQPHQRVGDSIPSVGSACGTGWKGENKQQRMMHKKGRGGGNWQPMPPFGNNFMSRGPPFCPPFPPPPNGMFFPPPPFMNGPPPPFFPPPPPYSSSGMPVDTSIPPPPYSMAPPPFFMGFPPPPPPSFFHSPPNPSNGGARMQQQQQQESQDSRPPSREGGGSLASTELSYGEHSQEGSYESSEEEEIAPSPEVNMGKRSYLIHLRPKAKRLEPGTTPPPIGDKEFETFTSILTKGNKKVSDTEIMDRFIIEFMKL